MSEIVKEIVLPSGRFVAFLPITWGDVIASYSDCAPAMVANIAARVCLIDGLRLTLEAINEMVLAEFIPIMNIIIEMLPKDMSARGVA